VSNRNQRGFQDDFSSEIPSWVRDNLVLKLLDDQGLAVEVVYDRKYLNGLSSSPLIVVRSKRHRGRR